MSFLNNWYNVSIYLTKKFAFYVKKTTSACAICFEIKSKLFKLPVVNLIKSLQPFKMLNMDFKGPLPSKTKNYYIFTVVDDFSRFLFLFSCKDNNKNTTINLF